MSERPLNILYATHGYKPAYRLGGPIYSVSAAAEELVRRGHRVVVYTSNANLDEVLDVPVNQPVDVSGVEVWYFERREPIKTFFKPIKYLAQTSGFFYTPDLPKILSQNINSFDLVHTQLPWTYPTTTVGRSGVRAGIPYFYQQRASFAPGYLAFRVLKKKLYISLVERPLMNQATTLIALTQAEVDSYRQLGVNTPCRIVPNGIEVGDYRKDSDDRLLQPLQIDRDAFLILFLARLHVIKGPQLLLEAFIKIASKFKDAILVIAGPDEHDLQSDLEAKVREAGLTGRVLFPGMVTGDLKVNLLARADLFCLPSAAEGFSMAVLEAMASTTPVMITPECNFPEAAQRDAGWIVMRDENDWARQLSQVLENRNRLRDAGLSGYKLVQQEYTWGKICACLESVYREGIRREDQARSVSQRGD